MGRLTKKLDKTDCRIPGVCPADFWIESITKTDSFYWTESPCEYCPFMKYINKLGEYEDKNERLEDDLK